MSRPSFRVITGVLTALVLLGFLTEAIRPYLPSSPVNRLSNETAGFLRQARFQPIDWHAMGEEPFVEARRTEKPILLLVGASWSPLGRRMDQSIFTAPEITRFLARNFVCVRVDLAETPAWRGAFLPLSRTNPPLSAEFQIYFLDATGRLYDLASSETELRGADVDRFLDRLMSARAGFEALHRRGFDRPVAGLRPQEDRALLAAETNQRYPNFLEHLNQIPEWIDPQNGGFRAPVPRLRPHSWEFLLRFGKPLPPGFDQTYQSPFGDWLDGGFFTEDAPRRWQASSFDKTAIGNASMMRVLALAALLEPSATLHRPFAEKTFDALAGPFSSEGLVRTARLGDADRRGRSPSGSVSQTELAALSTEERQTAIQRLGLRSTHNPSMSPYALQTDFFDPVHGPLLERTLRALRESTKQPTYESEPSLDVCGYVAARQIEVARWWGDEARLRSAIRLVDALERFRSGESLMHFRVTEYGPDPYLGDYLAYADALLQDYLATGRVVSFERGLEALEKALTLFQGDEPGAFNLALPSTFRAGPQLANAPEIADLSGPSCSAQIIRLASRYGALLLQSGTPVRPEIHRRGLALTQTALATIGLFSQTAVKLGPLASGYFDASAEVAAGVAAYAVGPNAVEKAAALCRQAPFCLVAPAFGDVRLDLQNRPPGFYVVREGRVEGPLDLAQAAESLAPSTESSSKNNLFSF